MVATVLLEDRSEEEMIIVAVDLPADPAVALRAVVHQLLDDQRPIVAAQVGGGDRRLGHGRASAACADRRAAATRFAISAAVAPAPTPFPIFTTVRPGAQVWSIVISAATPSPPSP